MIHQLDDSPCNKIKDSPGNKTKLHPGHTIFDSPGNKIIDSPGNKIIDSPWTKDKQFHIQRGEEGQPQQFLVRTTFSSFSSLSHLGILVR